MRSFFIFIAFVAVAAFAAQQYWTARSLNEKVTLLTMQLNAPRASPTPPVIHNVPTKQQIICPLCHGQKVVVYDPTGANNPLNRKSRQCPVCVGVGYRMLTVPAGQQLCPDCHGMGIVFYDSHGGHPPQAGNCTRCGATGLVAAID